MIPCPNCDKLAFFNTHFARYLCAYCGWASESKRGSNAEGGRTDPKSDIIKR